MFVRMYQNAHSHASGATVRVYEGAQFLLLAPLGLVPEADNDVVLTGSAGNERMFSGISL